MGTRVANARPGKGTPRSKRKSTRTGARAPTAPTLPRRVAWVALAGAWTFLVAALLSFDSADAPSHVVAVHNHPPANWCGTVGAFVAYWGYHVVGVGSWVIMAAWAGLLGATLAGRRVGHPLVRAIGVLLVAVSVSCLHALLLPRTGPLTGSPAGLVATRLVTEAAPRFNTVGTFLLLLATLGVGSVVAVDRLVLTAARALWRLLTAIRRGPGAARDWGRRLLARPTSAAKDGDDEAYDEEGEYDEDDEYEEDEEEDESEDDEHSALPHRPRLSAEQLRQKIARLPVRMAGRKKTIARDEDIPRDERFEGYRFPTLDLLCDPETGYSAKMETTVRRQAEQLEEALHTYGIDAEVVGIESGPSVTLYTVQLSPGTKVAKISAVSRDIARALRAQNIRIVPNIVGKTAIGIEVPNGTRERVRLKELMSGGHAHKMVLPMFLGKDASGEPLVADLTRMPHMLIAGTTGSGKSVCINSILMSWLYTKRPDELKLILVDPKMVELSQFADIPHLMCPVVTEATRAAAIMEWAIERMEERYDLLSEAGVRDIAGYNDLDEEDLCERFHAETEEERARVVKKMPLIVIVVDELADMMMTCKEVEHAIVRVAQKARAVGIHLILATQRPQANVVTGLIKSNMPCRVSFKVASGMDSRIVLDSKGAELLLGQGDMMLLTPHTTELVRSQGTLVEDVEIRRVVRFLKSVATPSFERSLIAIRAGREADAADGDDAERDPLFDPAVRVMIDSGRGSVSLLQRRLSIGYGRASRLVDQMSRAGIVGDHKGSVAREVLITSEEWNEMKALEETETETAEPDPPIIEMGRTDGATVE